jgi:acetolactate synthase I/II/III large subunit
VRAEFGASPAPWRPAAERVAAARRQATRPSEPESEPGQVPGAPLHPRLVVEALRAAVPDNTIVTCDAGENRLFMMQWFTAGGEGAYLQPAGGGGMGYAVPAAMGAKLAHPERPVLAVCGDGGFSMNLHGMLSALEQDLPICVAVLNNNALGWVLHGARKPVAADFQPFDFAAICAAMGCDAARPSTLEELTDLAARVKSLRRPLVIDIPTSLDVSFRTVRQDLDVP